MDNDTQPMNGNADAEDEIPASKYSGRHTRSRTKAGNWTLVSGIGNHETPSLPRPVLTSDGSCNSDSSYGTSSSTFSIRSDDNRSRAGTVTPPTDDESFEFMDAAGRNVSDIEIYSESPTALKGERRNHTKLAKPAEESRSIAGIPDAFPDLVIPSTSNDSESRQEREGINEEVQEPEIDEVVVSDASPEDQPDKQQQIPLVVADTDSSGEVNIGNPTNSETSLLPEKVDEQSDFATTPATRPSTPVSTSDETAQLPLGGGLGATANPNIDLQDDLIEEQVHALVKPETSPHIPEIKQGESPRLEQESEDKAVATAVKAEEEASRKAKDKEAAEAKAAAKAASKAAKAEEKALKKAKRKEATEAKAAAKAAKAEEETAKKAAKAEEEAAKKAKRKEATEAKAAAKAAKAEEETAKKAAKAEEEAAKKVLKEAAKVVAEQEAAAQEAAAQEAAAQQLKDDEARANEKTAPAAEYVDSASTSATSPSPSTTKSTASPQGKPQDFEPDFVLFGKELDAMSIHHNVLKVLKYNTKDKPKSRKSPKRGTPAPDSPSSPEKERKPAKNGYVYVYTSERCAGHVKIGMTSTTPQGRVDQWEQRCNLFKTRLISDPESHPFLHCELVEKLIKAELNNYRRKYACPICRNDSGEPVQHGEWYAISGDVALETVRKWRSWLVDQQPYSEDGVMQPRWSEKYKTFLEKTALVPTNTDPAGKNKWVDAWVQPLTNKEELSFKYSDSTKEVEYWRLGIHDFLWHYFEIFGHFERTGKKFVVILPLLFTVSIVSLAALGIFLYISARCAFIFVVSTIMVWLWRR